MNKAQNDLVAYLKSLPAEVRGEAVKAAKMQIFRDDPVLFCREVLEFTPNTIFQTQILTAKKPSKIIANVSRQSGKDFITAALACHDMIFSPPGFLAAVICVNQRQSMDLVRKVKMFLRKAQEAGLCPRLAVENAASLELAQTGNRIVALAGDSDAGIRGLSTDLLIINEASRVLQEVYSAAVPFLTRRPEARFIILSTPWAKDDNHFFSDIWHNGDPKEWIKLFATIDDAPISEETRRTLMSSLSEKAIRRELYCEFDQMETTFFSLDSVMDAFGGVAVGTPDEPSEEDNPERVLHREPAFNAFGANL